MAVDEPVRYRLRRRLEWLVGPEEAEAVMTSMPPFAWTDIATKRDLEGLHDALRAELYLVRADLVDRIDRLETRMDGLETRMDRLETRMDRFETRMDGLEARIGALEEKMGSYAAKLVLANIASSAAVAGAVIAAVRL